MANKLNRLKKKAAMRRITACGRQVSAEVDSFHFAEPREDLIEAYKDDMLDASLTYWFYERDPYPAQQLRWIDEDTGEERRACRVVYQ